MKINQLCGEVDLHMTGKYNNILRCFYFVFALGIGMDFLEWTEYNTYYLPNV